MKFFKKRFSLGLKFWNQGVVVSRSLEFVSFEIWQRVFSIYKTFRRFLPLENSRKKRKI